MMAGKDPPTSSVVTPNAKSSRQARCSRCPCQDFQSDDAIASAVNSDERTEALIGWFSGGATPTPADGGRTSPETSAPCPRRLHASIVILNAIRDACRPHLETASPSPGSPPPTSEEHATYEDSFPRLSTSRSAAPPTKLVGRKKSKGARRPSTSSAAASTTSANQREGPKNKHSQHYLTAGSHPIKNSTKAIENSHIDGDSRNGDNSAGEDKKRTKPVTFSLLTASSSLSGSTSPSLSNDQTSVNVGGNISCLPSQESGETRTASNFQISRRLRLVMIYSTILRTHLAPSILLELHLLVRLVSLSKKNLTLTMVDVDKSTPFSEMFQSGQPCRDFGAETLASLEAVLANLGHETIKMFLTLPALRQQCPALCTSLQGVIHTNNSAMILEAGRTALGCNANTPHLTLPFDHARDSRHNFRSVDSSKIYKEREGLRDSFLYQLRAFQDVRGRLMEEKHVEAIRYQSREMLKNLSPQNTLWFVSFFCELLLQIGLVPVSETDSEVVKQIGDKKRLQVSSFMSLACY